VVFTNTLTLREFWLDLIMGKRGNVRTTIMVLDPVDCM
jgi:hypothetical protein